MNRNPSFLSFNLTKDETVQRTERLQAGEDLDLYIELDQKQVTTGDEHLPEKPGRGVTVRPASDTWTTGFFLETLYSRALEDLGYEVKNPKKRGAPIFYRSLSMGDVDFWANGWFPLHDEFLPRN